MGNIWCRICVSVSELHNSLIWFCDAALIVNYFWRTSLFCIQLGSWKLPATRLKVKAMTQIHPVLREKRVVVRTPVSEVTKLWNRQPNFASVSLQFFKLLCISYFGFCNIFPVSKFLKNPFTTTYLIWGNNFYNLIVKMG